MWPNIFPNSWILVIKQIVNLTMYSQTRLWIGITAHILLLCTLLRRFVPCCVWELRASPKVLSMWLQTVKFIVNKSQCAGLAQEIGFSTPNSCSLPWLVKGTTQLCTRLKSVINWTWLQLSISHWSIIMIGSGGLLLVVPTYMQLRL